MTDTTGALRVTRSPRHGTAGSHETSDRRDDPVGTGIGGVEAMRAAELGPRHLLVLVRLRGHAPDTEVVVASESRREVRLPVAIVDAHFESGRRNGVPRHVLATVVQLPPRGTEPPDITLVSGTARHALPGATVLAAVTDLRTLLREDLAGLEATARTRLVSFLAEAVRADTEDGALSRARGLARVRDALREPAAVRPRGADQLQGINIDALHAVDERGFWIRGWLVDRDAPVTRLTAVSPEGHRVELLPDMFRCERPDLQRVFGSPPPGLGERDETGFVAFLELPAPSRAGDGWVVEMENTVGTITETAAPAVVVDGVAARDAILRDLALERPGARELSSRHARPALERLQRRVAGAASVRRVVEHGAVPERPTVSVIVPLYRRLDFLEQQLVHFVHDPELRHAEWIYVLDSPEQEAELAAMAPALHALYRVPFRVVYLEQNLGFSGANNAGVAFARGRKLLFLNSDVVPVGIGWLGRMVEFHDATPGIGALGPKLLYEDDSLQHAGLYFERCPQTELWENAHYYKGLHRTLPAANVARRVPAVTGACLMVDAALYRDLGGLRGMYIQGDYEDSDLCLRIMEAGRSNWYLPDVELYHLEGQSYPNAVRRRASAYNVWLHTHLWGPTIESLMTEPEFHDLRAPLLARSG